MGRTHNTGSLLLLFYSTNSLLHFVVNANRESQDDSFLVTTTNGQVKGFRSASSCGRSVQVFYGIPYAEPPNGSYRFRLPRPKQNWTGIFDATVMPNSCVQILDETFGNFSGSTMWNANTPMSEDCLALNVWTPDPRPTKAAVMVWIYGGGFYSGTSTLDVYDARTLAAEEEVVVVSMNYRVASLGFLYLGDERAPGNMGLLDQSMALEWIQRNIEHFGGDPGRVTLFGESAGAVSVSWHLLSATSRSMFSNAIMQSGAPMAPWAFKKADTLLETAKNLAKSLKCPGDIENNTTMIWLCLMNETAENIVSNEWNFVNNFLEFPFTPVVEEGSVKDVVEQYFRNETLEKKPVLLGSNREEASFFLIYYLPWLNETKPTKGDNFTETLRMLLPGVDNSTLQAVEALYIEGDSSDYRYALDKIMGDYHFTCPVVDWANRSADIDIPVFQYYFKHRSTGNPWPEWTGVMHGDEIAFEFGVPLNSSLSLPYEEDERRLSRRMMNYWANFAKTGDPNVDKPENTEGSDQTFASPNGDRNDGGKNGASWKPEVIWPKYTKEKNEYLALDINEAVGERHRQKYCTFWKTYSPNAPAYDGC
ncbi:acetylcholinesterase-like [Ixodes scapularis]|uniref:acetylcholinesterase-like n=1 Tax=Ixodes scapularis TaxID=6945 RepID=UPI001C392C7C|nr:acetylcholinesterase-like [Ixodes scapularis]